MSKFAGLRGKPHVKRKCYMLTSHHDVNALSNLFIIVKKNHHHNKNEKPITFVLSSQSMNIEDG